MNCNTYQSETLSGLYSYIYKDLLDSKEIGPRGLATKEIIAPQLILNNIHNRLAYHSERGFNSKFALVESLLIFDKTNMLSYYKYFNQNIAQFSDDGKRLFGAYGYRIAKYIPDIIEKLKDDKNTRQAVLPILRAQDVCEDTKDIPCTLSLHLIIRDNKLNMVGTMRSNDIIWGLPYDIFTFTTLQEIIANELGIDTGWYMHRPTSLHVYQKHYDMFEQIGDKFENRQIILPFDYDNWIGIKEEYKKIVNRKGHLNHNNYEFTQLNIFLKEIMSPSWEA